MEELPPDEASGSIGNTLLRCIASKINQQLLQKAPAFGGTATRGSALLATGKRRRPGAPQDKTERDCTSSWSGKYRTPTLDGYLWSCGSCIEWPIACDISTAPSGNTAHARGIDSADIDSANSAPYAALEPTNRPTGGVKMEWVGTEEDEMDSVLTQTVEHSKPATEIAHDEADAQTNSWQATLSEMPMPSCLTTTWTLTVVSVKTLSV